MIGPTSRHRGIGKTLIAVAGLCQLVTSQSVVVFPITPTNPAVTQGPRLPQQPHQAGKEDDQPVIELESDLVDIVFTVTDSSNRLLTDLAPDSVQILEDGVTQNVEFFGRNHDVPMVLALVVDFSGSQEFNWPKEREAAQSFFDEFFRWGKDYAALCSFRGMVTLERGLTNDHGRLENALTSLARIDEGYASQGSSLYDAAYVAVDEVLDGSTARRILNRHDNRIRRAMILITDGHDTSSLRKASEVIERAQQAGVLIFAVGVSDSFRFADVNSTNLDKMAAATGGRAYYPKNPDQLRRAFQQVADELSSQYIAAFYPTNTAKDGGTRSLEVRITGRGSVRISHRRSYIAKNSQ